MIELQLSDDGVGFDPGVPASGNGLRNMQWRARALGAQLSFNAQLSAQRGTSMLLVLPVHC